MIRTVHLHGPLGERFGREHRFDVVNPSEAVRALCVLFGHEFRAALKDGTWHVVAGDTLDAGEDFGAEDMLACGLGGMDLHLAPAVCGSEGGSFFNAILGVALLATAFIASPASWTVAGVSGGGMGATMFSAFGGSFTYGNLAALGAVMAVSGVASMLSPTPQLGNPYTSREKAEDTPSFLFNGPRNTSEQGGPIPLVYGRHRVGWTLISNGITVEQLEGEYGGKWREKPNTLQSRAITRVMGVVGAGEIGGLVDGAKSIYFGDTPLMAEDGTYNFEGVTWHERVGTPDQDPVPGFAEIENETSFGAEVSSSTPQVRTITNQDTDAVRVRIQCSEGLYYQHKKGKILPHEVEIAVDVRPLGGEWVEKVSDVIAGKTMSTYERAYRIERPCEGDFDIRVRKVTEDSETIYYKDTISWAAYTEIVDSKLYYPGIALYALEIDAELFGGQVPAISFEIYGRIVQVPSNYDAAARTYDGLWDGTFLRAWTDNPAWCTHDALTDSVDGAGIVSVDKWELYEVSRYCDPLVPDGYGSTEPRFTLNCVFQTQEEAYAVINCLAASFRGQCYWSSGMVAFSQDRPGLPLHKPVSAAAVENGVITYKGSSLKARHTVVFVTWNDPGRGGKTNIEIVEDPEAIAKFGYNPKHVVAFGCRYRGLAHRVGKWILETEANETEVASWVSGFEHADAVPGMVIPVADEVVAGVRMGGRIKNATVNQAVVDAPITVEPGEGYVMTLVLPDGVARDVALTNAPGETDTLIFAEPIPEAPLPNSLWVVSATNVETRQFRVLSNRFDSHKFELTCLINDPNKYDRVEQGVQFDPKPVSTVPTGPLPVPTGFSASDYIYVSSGITIEAGILASWELQAHDKRVVGYEINVFRPDGVVWEYAGWTLEASHEINPLDLGTHSVRVRSVSKTGQASAWSEELVVEVLGKMAPPADVTGFSAQQNGATVTYKWQQVVAKDLKGYEIRYAKSDQFSWPQALPVTSVTRGTLITNAALPPGDWTLGIKAVDTSDNYSEAAATYDIEVVNEYDVVAANDESGSWLGVMTNLIKHDVSGALVPVSGVLACDQGWETFDEFCSESLEGVYEGAEIDLGFDATARVYAELGGALPNGVPDPRFEIDHAMDGGEYDGFEGWTVGTIRARKIKPRVVVPAGRPCALSACRPVADVAEREERDVVTVPVGGLSVEFSQRYHSPPGIQLSAGGAEMRQPVYSDTTTTGFTITVYNSAGEDVGGEASYIAKGA